MESPSNVEVPLPISSKMTRLFDVISKQVEYLRAGDIENGTRLMPEVTKEYESMIETIRNINWEQ